MTIGILKETQRGETRVSMSPSIVKQILKKGFDVVVEEGAGATASFKDSDF